MAQQRGRGEERSPLFGALEGGRAVAAVRRRLRGIGARRAQRLCRRRGLLPATPWAQLPPPLRQAVEAEAAALPATGEQLRRRQRAQRRRREAGGTVRSIRRRRGLPVRGQRTKSNGRTAKRLNGARYHRFV